MPPERAAAIVTAVDGRGARLFHAVPRAIYGDRWPAWTPLIPSEESAQFDRRRNPSLVDTRVSRWIALADGAPAGRIAAFAPLEPRDVGYFGFFESADDPAVATSLLRTAEGWLAERGRKRVYGPITVNPRDQIGLLIDGFESPASVLTPYNPPYYARLLEEAGYQPAVLLRAYGWRPDMADLRGMVALGERIAAREGIRIRPLNPKALAAEALLFAGLINSTFGALWGYVPITDAEARDLARQLRPVLDPSLCLVAEARGEPCGVVITVPDANWLVRKIGGRLWPFGWLRALWLRRRIPAARVMAMAVLPGRRASGVAVQLIVATHRALVAKGYRYAEVAQVFDDNVLMRRLLERAGCPVVKRYAVFQRPPSEASLP
jgi:GNAT superfamily N-acetyltransferase